MTLSLRKAALTLALLGGAGLMVAASATANAGPPDGYFNHRYRYIDPAFPPPAYAEIVPIYPEAICPAPVYPPEYSAPIYDQPGAIYYEDGYSYGPEWGPNYVTPDGALAVGLD